MPEKAGLHCCAQCSRTFARSEHLVRHKRTHTKEKLFQCLQCPQSFSRSDLLRRHYTKHHNGNATSDRSGGPATTTQHTEPLEASPAVAMSVGESSTSAGLLSNSAPDTDLAASEKYHLEQSDLGRSANADADRFAGPANTIPWDAEGIPDFGMNEAFDTFFSENRSVPDWLLNFPGSGDSFHLSTSSFPDQSSTPMGSSTEGQQSLLSRPSSPTREVPLSHGSWTSAARSAHVRDFALGFECTARLQEEVSRVGLPSIPSGAVLSRYIRRYFRSFNCHQPFLHEATWEPDTASPSLLLAVCANGAVYDMEQTTALRLYDAALCTMSPFDEELSLLQTHMLCIAFAAWQGTTESIMSAAKLLVSVQPHLRRQHVSKEGLDWMGDQTWYEWTRRESLSRVSCCLLTLSTLMSIAYDIGQTISPEIALGLPAPEAEWYAASEEDWRHHTSTPATPRGRLVESIETTLADTSSALPSNVGILGCHVTMIAILNRIIMLRKSMASSDKTFSRRQADLTLRLRRWQRMWEAEPEASLLPDNPQGPITFNATALLRVAYVRLAADFSDVRGAFTFCDHAEQIEPFVNAMPLPARDEYATRAALQAALALRIPVKLGIKIVSRTSFWIWSVQHALCYFECAIFLSKWLDAIQGALDLDAQESAVVRIVEEILQDVRGARQSGVEPPSYHELLRSWATLLNTADTTVWQLIPKMAKVLELYSMRKSRAFETYGS